MKKIQISMRIGALAFVALLAIYSQLSMTAQAQVSAEQSKSNEVSDKKAEIVADPSLPALSVEPIGIIESLPAQYPNSWFAVIESAFSHMLDGKVIIIDAAKDTVAEQVKGTFNVALMGTIAQSDKRSEFYAIETFHERGSRGKRTDVLTIYSKENLAPVAEVVWPTPKRFQGMPERYAISLINDDKLLLVYNFNPAASVTVIDLDTRKIINEVQTPACSLMYPTGQLSFTSICSNGGLLTTSLKADGSLDKQTRVDSFFDPVDNPVFERPAIVDGIGYFPSFVGQMNVVDLRGDVAKVVDQWSLLSEQERKANWRPAGIELMDQDSQGHLYIIMQADGHEGTHTEGGSEIWVFDTVKKQRIKRIALKEWGLSVAVSRGDNPMLLVTNPVDMSLEVYNASTGDFQRKIKGIGEETPLISFSIGDK